MHVSVFNEVNFLFKPWISVHAKFSSLKFIVSCRHVKFVYSNAIFYGNGPVESVLHTLQKLQTSANINIDSGAYATVLYFQCQEDRTNIRIPNRKKTLSRRTSFSFQLERFFKNHRRMSFEAKQTFKKTQNSTQKAVNQGFPKALVDHMALRQNSKTLRVRVKSVQKPPIEIKSELYKKYVQCHKDITKICLV